MNDVEIYQRKRPGVSRWLITSLALGLLLTAAACASAMQTSTSPASSTPTARQTSASPVSTTGDPAIGPADAPVTIVEYGDFG